eukprot:376424_1
MAPQQAEQVDSRSMGGVKDNPFLKKKSMHQTFERQRKLSKGLASIRKGKISNILLKWNQNHAKSDEYVAPVRARPKELQNPYSIIEPTTNLEIIQQPKSEKPQSKPQPEPEKK